MENTTLVPLKINGKISKKLIRSFSKYAWDNKGFLFSQWVAFRFRDKELMEKAFKLWFNDVVKTYGKSKWIEVLVFTRKKK